MNKRGIIGLMTMLLLALGPNACSGTEASCVDECEEAQAENCTSIKGDCSAFCEAAFNVDEGSGCQDEHDAYQECIESADDVCTSSCDGLENDYSSCVTAYCLTRSDTPDCQTLINSF